MNKKFWGVMAVLAVLSAASCATKEHWTGVYAGVVPTVDGEEAHVKITLNKNETYKFERRVGGDVDTNAGKFIWNDERDTIIVEREYYKIGIDAMIHLVVEGDVIFGDITNDYLLYKQK